MAKVVLRKVRKEFGSSVVVHDIDLTIPHQEFVVLVGPSGCGKSTTLRMIAGLEDISAGEIHIGDTLVNDMPPKDRNIAMVFQSYALYPYATVWENMAFGLRVRRYPQAEIRRRVEAAADILGIRDMLDRKPRQLSGGQRQRVAIGRAIVRDPEVFLFDEPLSNLDAKLRVQMRTEIKKIHQRVATTMIYVTHDQVEAMTLAQRIVVMNAGRIEQIGTPQDMYERPATRFVAGFIGSPAMNFVPCSISDGGAELGVRIGESLVLPVPAGRRDRYRAYSGRSMLLGIRPEHCFDAKTHQPAAGQAPFEIVAGVVEPLGIDTMVHFELAATPVCARVNSYAVSSEGERLAMVMDMNNMHLIDPQTDKVV